MTRVNASIRPAELCDSMLFAEYREIKRIPNSIKSGRAIVNNIPKNFKLGEGHVKFFYNKLKYLSKRSKILYEECLRRKIDVEDYSNSYKDLPEYLFNDWEENNDSRLLLKQRINSKLLNSNNPIRFYKTEVTIQEALIK